MEEYVWNGAWGPNSQEIKQFTNQKLRKAGLCFGSEFFLLIHYHLSTNEMKFNEIFHEICRK